MGNGKRTTTSQLASPAAYTRRAVLQVTLSDLPVMTTSGSVPPSARRKALSQASLFWQTLQPTPPHPLSQVHPREVPIIFSGNTVNQRGRTACMRNSDSNHQRLPSFPTRTQGYTSREIGGKEPWVLEDDQQTLLCKGRRSASASLKFVVVEM